MNDKLKGSEDPRPAQILEVISKFAAGDLTARGTLAGDDSTLDGVMAGINILGEELEASVAENRQAQQALSESEALLRSIFDSVQDGIIVADARTRHFRMANAAMCRMLGYSPDEMLKLGLQGVHPAEQLAYAINQFERLGKGEIGIAASLPMKRKDGTIFYADVNSGPMTINGVACLVGVFRDITERKQAEDKILNLNQALEAKVQQLLATQEELEQHRAHLEQEVAQRTASLMEAQRIAHLGNWEWDVINNTVNWSDEMYRIFGYVPQQFDASYEAFLDAVHPEDRQLVDDTVRDALARQHTYSIEHRILQPDGTLRYVHGQAEVMQGDDGQTISMVGTLQDITERKLAEQTATDERNFSNTLIASQPDIFYVLDPTGRFIRWNDKLRDLLGYSDSQMAATNALDIIHEADRPSVAQKTRETFELGTATNVARLLTKTGIRDFSLTATRVDTAKGAYAIGVGTDITERKQMETELRESELAYRTLSQNLPGMVYRVFIREGGRMQFYNDMPAQMTGYAADELTTGKVCSIEPLILDDDRPGVEAEVRRAMAEKRAFAVEYRLKHRDGGIRWMSENGMPVYGPDATPLYIDGVIFDITEQKQDEIDLQLFRTLLDNSSDAVEVIDPVTLRFLDVNETACRELGYSREELLTMNVQDIDPNVDTDAVVMVNEQLKESGSARFETMHRRKDGSIFPVEVNIGTIVLEETYLLNIVRDITERKQAEEVLRYRTTVLSILQWISPSAILVVNENARIVSYNEKFIQMWDLPGEMVKAGIDEPVLRKVCEQVENPEEFLARVKYLYEHKKETSHDELRLLDGRIIDRHSSPIADDEGRYYGRVWDFRDITELKRTTEKVRELNDELELKVRARTQQLLDAQEELVRKEKLALLGQVAGSVGHELRNPLGVMNNAIYFLQTVLVDADETTREYLEIIKSEIADADRIVADLLDSVRTKPPRPAAVNVGELIDQTLRTLIVPATMTVTLDLPGTLPPVWVDGRQIQQVFRNLISNAVEAMGEDGTLAIDAVENRQEGTVSVSVRDTGCGMPPEVLARLFQPLFTTKARGIGLGMVVVKNLTEANGGTVEVESVPGEGSRFFVTLPRGEGDMT